MSRMFNPSHPGEILKEDVLPELGITVTAAASQLGITRVVFSRIINGKAGISPDMALRLAAWLKPSAESWLRVLASFGLVERKRVNVQEGGLHWCRR